MATIKYLIKGKGELSSIYIRVRKGREIDLTTSTGYIIKPQYWSSAKGDVKQVAEFSGKLNLSNKLKGLRREVEDRLNDTVGEINSDWIKDVIAGYKDPLLKNGIHLLTDQMIAYQNKLKVKVNPKTGKPISKNTYKTFKTTVNHLEAYERSIGSRVKVSDVDLRFHENYKRFCSEVLKLKTNTISKDFKQIKTTCFHARDIGVEINKQVESKRFSAPTEMTEFVTLTAEDLNKIREFRGSNYLENARDWLIIGCWTGCRVGDLMKLTSDHIKDYGNGVKYLQYVQGKTGKAVSLGIHPHVQEILIREGGFPRKISDQKFNKYIKEVCSKIDSIKEKAPRVMTHTCRRSFATNHYNKLSNKQIMAVTGHSTEKMLLSYIGEVEVEHIDAFIKLWENEPH